jgi:hypothetical protein
MKMVLSLLICLVLSAASYADVPQVVNPGFELMSGDPLVPDGWNLFTGNGATVFFAGKADVVRTGTYSMKVAARNGYGMIHQTITSGFAAGETYSLWFYGRGDTNNDWVMDEPLDRIELSVKFANSGGGTISEPKIIVFDANPETAAPMLSKTEWLQSPIFRFTVPEGTASMMIKISAIDGSPDGNTRDGTSIYMDDVTLALLPLPAKNPTPIVGATEQNPTSLFLSWEPGDDPRSAGTPNPDVTGYYIYFDQFDTSDVSSEPNFMNPVSVSGAQYPATGPGAAFGTDQLVYWRVDTSINGSTAGDPNTVTGPTWYFETESSFPEIIAQPQDVTVFEGEPAAISIEATGVAPIVQYEWYDSNDLLVASGPTLDTLTFPATVIEDSDLYYCVIINSEGKATQSQTAALYVKGMLAQYDFENALTDAIGGLAGVAKNIDPNEAGVVGYAAGISGQTLVLDDGNYVELPDGAYPNSYMGLAHGTLVCWVKTTSETTGTLIGAYNDSLKTCYNLSIQESEGLYFYLRSESGAFTTVQVSAPGIFDGNWHQIAVTYSLGTPSTVYMDGEKLGTGGGLGTSAVFAPWTYTLPLGAGDTRGEINKVYAGALDSVVLYNYVKTEKEVLDMYNALSPVEKSLCLDPYASAFDLAGPDGVGAEFADCRVNLYDFAAMAAAWLDCGLYPDCE